MPSEQRFHNSSLTPQQKTNFRLWLQKHFTDRCKRNPRHSLRAFAKFLEMNPSSLSQILSGKRPISKRAIKVLCDKLAASKRDIRSFGLLESRSGDAFEFSQLGLDTFSVISEWYYYAILELTFTSGFKSDHRWIARKLSITIQEAKSAVERLLRLGLVREENGSLIKTSENLTNHSNINTSEAHRELQRQIVGKALLAIDECQPEEKDITSMTMAIDETNLPEARELIRKFRRDLCALLEDGSQDRVYHLGVQLYPVSKSEISPQEKT